jgi:hypothetical protein
MPARLVNETRALLRKFEFLLVGMASQAKITRVDPSVLEDIHLLAPNISRSAYCDHLL